jgi:ABC-2 type transport system permease protein
MLKIKTILLKEWAEVFRNRMVLFSVAFLPLLMTAIPLVILYAMRGEAAMQDMGSQLPEQFNAFCPQGLSGGECFQVYMVSQFMIMFMILPLAIPSSIASYSIVGEKVNRSLEPVLATPITTVELLAGKSLAALIPAVGATYAAFALFAIGAWLLAPNPTLLKALLDVRWLLAIGVVGPLMALMAVNFTVMISSRVSDPRIAEQLSVLIILPVLGVFFGQMAGLFIINRLFVSVSALILVLLDALFVYAAVRVFDREVILTRWK